MKVEENEAIIFEDIAYRYVRQAELNELSFEDGYKMMFTLVDSLGFSEVDYVESLFAMVKAISEDFGCFVFAESQGEHIATGFIKDAAPTKDGAARLEFFNVVSRLRRKGVAKYIISKVVDDYDERTGITVSCEKKLISLCETCGFMNPKRTSGRHWYVLHSKKTTFNSKFCTVAIQDPASYEAIRINLQKMREEFGV